MSIFVVSVGLLALIGKTQAQEYDTSAAPYGRYFSLLGDPYA